MRNKNILFERKYFFTLIAILIAFMLAMAPTMCLKKKDIEKQQAKEIITDSVNSVNMDSAKTPYFRHYKINTNDFEEIVNFIQEKGYGKGGEIDFNHSYDFIDRKGNFFSFTSTKYDEEDLSLSGPSSFESILLVITPRGSGQSTITYVVDRDKISPISSSPAWEDSSVTIEGFKEFLKKIRK